MLLHIQAFQPHQRTSTTIWQQLTPQTRVICMIIAVFANSFTPHGQWLTGAIYGISVFLVICLSRVSGLALLSRVAVEFAFIAVILLGTLFRGGGETLWSWGFLRITTEGVIVLGSVTLKVLISLLWVNLLILTTQIPDLLQSLLALRCPPLIVAIMASMYRYLNLLVSEFTTMRRAAQSRNLLLTPQSARRVIGHMMGSLFIRTLDRGERIYQAMLARGYSQTLVFAHLPPYRRRDAIAIITTGIIAFLGQLIAYF